MVSLGSLRLLILEEQLVLAIDYFNADKNAANRIEKLAMSRYALAQNLAKSGNRSRARGLLYDALLNIDELIRREKSNDNYKDLGKRIINKIKET
jgi:hypothetical protein